MTYKSILVPIGSSPQTARRVEVAGRIAALLGAQVSGIAIVAPLELPQRLRSHPGAKAILKEEFEKALANAKGIARDFPASARAAGAPAAVARVAEAGPEEALATAARAADLVVLSQPDADDIGALGSHFVERMVIECARPVLVVPRKAKLGEVGRNLLIAWKDADASARALADARPFFAGARSIRVLTVDEGEGRASADEALDYVQRHGGKATAIAARSADAGGAILSHAKKSGADLVVMGAFARTRLAEMVLGGATRRVLRDMGTCVLMSH